MFFNQRSCCSRCCRHCCGCGHDSNQITGHGDRLPARHRVVYHGPFRIRGQRLWLYPPLCLCKRCRQRHRLGLWMRLLRPDILNVSTARFRAVHTAVSGGAMSGLMLCVPSLFCAPGMGLAAMPVFILPCRRGQDLPFFYPAHSVSAPQPCVCFAQSAPFRRVHPLLLASNQRLRCFLAAFFCSNPCPFPSGWRMALLRLSSAIKKSPFRALFLCIYQRALPSRTSTCVNVAYLPTPPLGFRRLAMS